MKRLSLEIDASQVDLDSLHFWPRFIVYAVLFLS
jgi:hypothetical protein